MSESSLPNRTLHGRRPGPELTISTSHEQRVLAQSFPSPSDKLLSPVSRALQGGMRKRLFATSNHMGPNPNKSPKNKLLNNNNGLRSPTNINIAPRTVLARKAIRQAYLSASKPQSTVSRITNCNYNIDNAVPELSNTTTSSSSSLTSTISTIPETYHTPTKGTPSTEQSSETDDNQDTKASVPSLSKIGSFFLPSNTNTENTIQDNNNKHNNSTVSPNNNNRVPLSPK